jgi:hypothetical protein
MASFQFNSVVDETNTNTWMHIESCPRNFRVDIRYCNDTFDMPVSGILEGATLDRAGLFWVSSKGQQVPAKFAVMWRLQPQSKDDEARALHPSAGVLNVRRSV